MLHLHGKDAQAPAGHVLVTRPRDYLEDGAGGSHKKTMHAGACQPRTGREDAILTPACLGIGIFKVWTC